jgi:hypothetical protein
MRYMIIVKATRDSEAGVMPEEKMLASMATYHEELVKAGVLLDATGLQPTSKGWRVRYAGAKRTVLDGPFAEAKELIAGYTLYGINTLMMVLALKNGEMSLLYPIIALTYVWTTLLSYTILGETPNLYKDVGIVTIVVGVAVMGRRGSK